MSAPISVGSSIAPSTNAESGGPFDVQSDIVFSGGYVGGFYPTDPYTTSVTQIPTAEATGQGSVSGPGISAGASTPTASATNSAIAGLSLTTWLLIGGVAVAVWWYVKHKK